MLPALGANDKVRMGWIGVGSRGSYLLDRMKHGSGDWWKSRPSAIPYTGRLSAAKDKVQTLWNNSPKTYEDYQQLLADPNIDAVVIATPEHLHYPMFMAALKAGKNIYVEKPLAHTIEQGKEMVAAAREVRQSDSGGHAEPQQYACTSAPKRWWREGMIGDVHYVRAFWYRNSLDDNPAWRYKIPPDANPQNTDWKKFLGGRARDSPSICSATISGGCIGITRAASRPICWCIRPTSRTSCAARRCRSSCMASGGIYRWTEARTIAMCRIRSAPSTNIRTGSTSTTAATSATIITATARTSWATKAPSKC